MGIVVAVFQTRFGQSKVFNVFHRLRGQQESQQLSIPPLTDFAPRRHRTNTASP